MEHSLSPLQLPEVWRTRALVVAAVAGIELVVILSVAVAILSKPIAAKIDDAAEKKVLAPVKPVKRPKREPPAVVVRKLERGETSVLVLNGNGRTGAAAQEAERIKSLGYLIGGTGNAPNRDYVRTIVMYRPGYRLEAKRLAKDAGLSIVTPLDGMTTKDLLGAHLALVLGP